MLLPARAPLRHADAIEVVGAALLAHAAAGQGHRSIAAALGEPADTVRRWLRRVTGRGEWLRQQGTVGAHQHDPMLAPIGPAHSALADALAALGTAAAAWVRRVGPIGLPWQIIAIIAGGRLLTPLRSD